MFTAVSYLIRNEPEIENPRSIYDLHTRSKSDQLELALDLPLTNILVLGVIARSSSPKSNFHPFA